MTTSNYLCNDMYVRLFVGRIVEQLFRHLNIHIMSSRQGGKAKPLKVFKFGSRLRWMVLISLKAPKKEKKEESEEEVAFKEKKKAEAAAMKVAREKGTC